SLTLDVEGSVRGERLADTVVDTYGRLGITVDINKIPSNEFFNILTDPKKSHDLTLSGWAPDWPGGSGSIPALFDGDLIKDGGNTNYGKLDDPKINKLIDEAGAESDPDKAHKLWGELDEKLQKHAAAVPIVYAKLLALCGQDVRGGVLNTALGAVDIASLGVK
ncbi:MAG: hypothetical protein ACRD0P_11750, partial [Stackebrandtia sp.]